MRIDVLTLFPEMFEGPLHSSILGRALAGGIAAVHLHNIRDYAIDKHSVVDDYAYGGGPGMVMKPEPLAAAIESVRELVEPRGRTVLLTPQGRLLRQAVVDELVSETRLLLVCGHYEGVDERIREHFVDDEVSIGDYVLSGGELAALVVIDAVVRRMPGTLGSAESLLEESHSDAVHAAGGVSWNGRSRYTAFRSSRRNRALAAPAANTQDSTKTAGPHGKGGA
jgi:tRNA (guanine37-N1)-methyltransferase